MLARLQIPCPCGDAAPVTVHGPGPCPRCGAMPSAQALRGFSSRSAFRVWHIALASAATCAALGASSLSYSLQATSYRRVFQDLGRTLPALTNLLMHQELVFAAYGSLAASAVLVPLLVRQRNRRGLGVGLWPGRALFWLILMTLVLDAVIAEALHRPFVDLIESLR